MSSVPAPDDRLSGYLDDELAPDDRAAVEELLERSDTWRAALDAVAWARDAVRGLPPRDAPTGFWERAAHEPDRHEPDRGVARARWPRCARLVTAVAVAAGFTAVLFLPTESPDQPGARPGRVLTVHAPRVGAPSLDADAVIETDAAGTVGASDNSDDGTLNRIVENALDPFDW